MWSSVLLGGLTPVCLVIVAIRNIECILPHCDTATCSRRTRRVEPATLEV